MQIRSDKIVGLPLTGPLCPPLPLGPWNLPLAQPPSPLPILPVPRKRDEVALARTRPLCLVKVVLLPVRAPPSLEPVTSRSVVPCLQQGMNHDTLMTTTQPVLLSAFRSLSSNVTPVSK